MSHGIEQPARYKITNQPDGARRLVPLRKFEIARGGGCSSNQRMV